jgi:hypothetical protein
MACNFDDLLNISDVVHRENIVNKDVSAEENANKIKIFIDNLIQNSKLVKMEVRQLAHECSFILLSFMYIYETQFGLIQIYTMGEYSLHDQNSRDKLISARKNSPVDIDYLQIMHEVIDNL